LMFRFTACISSSVVVDSCQPLFTIIFLDLLLVLEVSGCFSYILLETTTYSINEISKIVGYDNQLYFSRLFHKLKGYSPREYQKIRNKF
jgi:AraC-like DNA-binding protein